MKRTDYTQKWFTFVKLHVQFTIRKMYDAAYSFRCAKLAHLVDEKRKTTIDLIALFS